MAGKYTLEGKNGVVACEMLKRVTAVLEKHKIDYWLEGGTLLGVIRENRLLPWDNDLDISITERYYDQLIAILPELKKLGYMVWSKHFDIDESPFSSDKLRIVKLRTRKFFFIRGEVGLDIFIKFKKEDRYYWQVGKKMKSSPAQFYDTLTTYPFDGKNYMVPEDYEGYLTYRYGDWQKTVKVWNTFKDDHAIKHQEEKSQ